MFQGRKRGRRATPVATSRQQWQHRLERSRLANVLAALVVVVGMLGVLLPGLVPPLWQGIAIEARLLIAALETGHLATEVVPLLPSTAAVVMILIVLMLPMALYIRFLVAAIDVHGHRQRQRFAGAWARGVTSLSSSPLSRASATANLVASMVMATSALVILVLTVPVEQMAPFFALSPLLTVTFCAAALGGALVWMAEELHLVYWAARSIGTLVPRTRSVAPQALVSVQCPVCHGAVLSRSIVVRAGKDAGRAGIKALRSSQGAFFDGARRIEVFIRRDPLKIVILVVIMFPAVVGIGVEAYMMMLVVAGVMSLLCWIFTRNIGMMMFVFPGSGSVVRVLGALAAGVGVLLNCSLVIRIVDWGDAAFSGMRSEFDENYAALFLLSSEAVGIVFVLALMGYRLRAMRPIEVLGRSGFPLLTLLLAAVVAPWAVTFAAFLIGLDFGKPRLGSKLTDAG